MCTSLTRMLKVIPYWEEAWLERGKMLAPRPMSYKSGLPEQKRQTGYQKEMTIERNIEKYYSNR